MDVQESDGVPEWRGIAEWDWVQIGNGYALHAVGTITNAATVDYDWVGRGATECGRRGDMYIPGVFSRMGAPRCKRCCARTGMPQGQQSPKNVDACRPIAERRREALGHGRSRTVASVPGQEYGDR